MLPFRSLDPFRPLREPDRRRRDEERLSRSEQRTANKPKDHLTGKAPYRFESASLRRRVHLTGAFVAAGANAASDQRLFHADGRARLWDAAATERERGAATLARWIFTERPTELHVRRLQREEQLPGRRSAEQIGHAAEVLVEATLHNERFWPLGVLSDWPRWAYARKRQAKKR